MVYYAFQIKHEIDYKPWLVKMSILIDCWVTGLVTQEQYLV